MSTEYVAVAPESDEPERGWTVWTRGREPNHRVAWFGQQGEEAAKEVATLLNEAEGLRVAEETRALTEWEEWLALATATTLHLLPQEALIASIRQLAIRLLEVHGYFPWNISLGMERLAGPAEMAAQKAPLILLPDGYNKWRILEADYGFGEPITATGFYGIEDRRYKELTVVNGRLADALKVLHRLEGCR